VPVFEEKGAIAGICHSFGLRGGGGRGAGGAGGGGGVGGGGVNL
jgi:hypothetical protein